MEVFDAIRRRRAVRDYRPDPISRIQLEQIIIAASWAPSAVNAQPWRFTVVTDQGLMDGISDQAKRFNLTTMAGMPQADHFRDVMTDPGFNIFYNAPALLVISAPGQARWTTEDCSLAAANAMLAAVDLGLGSCWIGFAQGWLNSPDGLASLGLSSGQRVVAPLILGYPKAPPPPVTRKIPEVDWLGRDRVAKAGEEGTSFCPPSPACPETWNGWEPYMVYPRNAELSASGTDVSDTRPL